MKVYMVGTSIATRGGISGVVRRLAEAGLFERWKVTYIASHRGRNPFTKLAFAFAGFARLLWGLARHRRGVLHAHVASRASFWRKAVFMSAALAAGWPVIFHLHGGGFARFHATGSAFTRRAIRFFLARAAAVVVLSDRWAHWVRTQCPEARILCIPNPVVLPPAVPRPAGALVAFTGRCVPGKGVRELVEAVAALVDTVPGVRLEVAGEGDLADLERRATALGIRGHVHLRGWLGDAQRDELLRRATVFVLPSHAEGLPLSLLEAMAAGCPVIATTVGGIPDVVVDGENGLLVPPRDPEALRRAILRVLTDPALADHLGARARETIAARFTAARIVGRFDDLYASLGCGRATPPAPKARTATLQESA